MYKGDPGHTHLLYVLPEKEVSRSHTKVPSGLGVGPFDICCKSREVTSCLQHTRTSTQTQTQTRIRTRTKENPRNTGQGQRAFGLQGHHKLACGHPRAAAKTDTPGRGGCVARFVHPAV